MTHHDISFLIEIERRREEMAIAAQHRLVKQAQKAGMKIPPLLSLNNANIGLLAVELANSLDWLSRLFAVWSCWLHSRFASVSFGGSPESQSSPCDS